MAARRTQVVVRALARSDVEAAVRWYAGQAGAAMAEAFVAEYEHVCARVGRQPGSGSPRWAERLGIPGLRSVTPRRFPYVVFYVEGAERIEVWRVLHQARDIPASLIEPGV